MERKPWIADRKFFRAIDTPIVSRSTTYPIISSRVSISVLSKATVFGPRRLEQIQAGTDSLVSDAMSSSKQTPITSSTYISVKLLRRDLNSHFKVLVTR